MSVLPPPVVYRAEPRLISVRKAATTPPVDTVGTPPVVPVDFDERAAIDDAVVADVGAAIDGGAADDDGPRWPDEATESAFLSDQPPRLAEISVPLAKDVSPKKSSPEVNVALPPLQSLVDRIPAEARETLEDLFRARFVSVKRVQAENLKVDSSAN